MNCSNSAHTTLPIDGTNKERFFCNQLKFTQISAWVRKRKRSEKRDEDRDAVEDKQ